jgi:hypothetical protein
MSQNSLSNYEAFPIKTKFRDDLLEQLAELALRGGKIQVEDIEVEVTVEGAE